MFTLWYLCGWSRRSDIHIHFQITFKKLWKNYKRLKKLKKIKITKQNDLFSVFVRSVASRDTNFKIIQNTKNLNKKVSKLSKKSNLFSNSFFIKNYVTLTLHCEWRYVAAKINPHRAQKNQKNYFYFFCTSFYIFFGKINILK